ncbi:MAG: DUF4328 domain-containing protein [Actinobacteria bacterium]|nr:DUF4328 domain-containing protein [Actinomycetota bacterium]
MSTSEPPAPPPGAAPPPPPPPPPPPLARWRGLQGLKTALSWLLAIDGIISLVLIAAVVNRIGVIDDLRGGDRGFDILNRAHDADDFASAAGVAFLLFVLATAVCFIVWTWRAAKNNEGLGRVEPRLTAAWAIAGWLIPLAFFVIPVLVVQDLWRGSDSSVPPGDSRWKIGPRSALVGWWWAVSLLSVIRIYAGGSTEADNRLSDIRASNVRAGIGSAFTIAAAVLAILVVRRITERQEECRRVQQGGVAPPPPPSGSLAS